MDTNDEQLTKKERRELKREEKSEKIEQAVQKKQVKRFTLWIGVIIIVVGAVFGLVRFGGDTQTEHQTGSLENAISDSDHTKGNKDATVTLIEYSDFQCPACGAYFPLVKQLTEEFGNDILFAYRHFPLERIHQNAKRAAQAAVAAEKQGKFWEMHDMIFENQAAWSPKRDPKDSFVSYAENLGLDREQFENDFDSDEVKERVERDIESGFQANIPGTPTFFLNGERIDSPQSYEDFANLIRAALQNNSQ